MRVSYTICTYVHRYALSKMRLIKCSSCNKCTRTTFESWCWYLSRLMTKPNKMICAPSEDSDPDWHPPSMISLRWPHEETLCLQLSNERTAKTDQTGRTPRLICPVWSESSLDAVGFVMRRLIWAGAQQDIKVVYAPGELRSACTFAQSGQSSLSEWRSSGLPIERPAKIFHTAWMRRLTSVVAGHASFSRFCCAGAEETKTSSCNGLLLEDKINECTSCSCHKEKQTTRDLSFNSTTVRTIDLLHMVALVLEGGLVVRVFSDV